MKSFALLIFSAIPFLSLHAQPPPTHLRLLQAGEQHVLIQLSENVPQIDTLAFDGQQYSVVEFADQTSSVMTATLELPAILCQVAIPPGATNLRATLQHPQWRPAGLPFRPLPARRTVRDSTLTRIQMSASAELAGADLPTLTIEGVGYFRNTRLAQIRLLPLQLSPEGTVYLHSADILVQWSAPHQTDPAGSLLSAISDAADPALRRAVINPDQLQAFSRRPPHPILLKSSQKAGDEFLKIYIDRTGLYKILGSTLSENGIPITTAGSGQFRLYNNGGRPLNERLTASRPDSLEEVPMLIEDGGDGRIDANDAIYFWGQSVNDWEFAAGEQQWRHYTNPYTTQNVYWLSWRELPRPARRLTTGTAPGGSGERQALGGVLLKIENELINPIDSGRQWFGKELSAEDREAQYKFNVKTATPQGGSLILRAVSITTGLHQLAVALNDQSLGTLSWFGRIGQDGYLYMVTREQSFDLAGALQSGENTITLQYSSSASFGSIYVDWLELKYDDALAAEDGVVQFTAPAGIGTRTYELSGLEGSSYLLEVSRPSSPRLLSFERQGNSLVFTDSLSRSSSRRYFASSQFLTPPRFERYVATGLRQLPAGADLLIISHKDFLQEAQRLADHKQSFRGLRTAVVDVQDIIDEFSWGVVDPTAIRDFVAFTFNNWDPQPRYLLLFGDGDFDYRNITSNADKNWVPPYQSQDSPGYIDQLESRAVEAYYTYVSGDDVVMDLAIGRLPVQTASEARAVVDKIISYESNPVRGLWRTYVTMVGDDELVRGGKGNETFHISDAEAIAQNFIPKFLNLRKIYLTEYRAVRNAEVSGVRKPDAQEDLIRQLDAGTLLVNFVGHGNPQQWAHEKVFVQTEDYVRVQNGMKLPFFVAATCNFGEFDDPKSQSFTEDLLNAAGRGAIGLLTSSRVVYASSNARFNKEYYRQLFSGGLATLTVGEAMALARLFTSNTINDEKYTVIGDPSLKLAIPQNLARVSTILPDSLIALNQTQVRGDLRDTNNVLLAESGNISMTVSDEPRLVNYLTEAGSLIRYVLPGNLLFQGSGTATAGQFSIRFIVPKDLTYGGRDSRISLYGAGEGWEAIGYRDAIPISLRSNLLFDNEGPQITISFEGRERFFSGDPIPQGAKLIATLVDSISGINVTGEIGHKITLTLDGAVQAQEDLTQTFVYFPDSFSSGQLITPLPELSIGRHFAELKAWDNSNNSSKSAFDFIITEAGTVQLSEIMNYPNPFRRETNFTFVSTSEAEAKISIYTVAGRLVRTIENIAVVPGYNQIPWDGRDADGDALANGVYLYRLLARPLGAEGKSAEYMGKLAVQ